MIPMGPGGGLCPKSLETLLCASHNTFLDERACRYNFHLDRASQSLSYPAHVCPLKATCLRLLLACEALREGLKFSAARSLLAAFHYLVGPESLRRLSAEQTLGELLVMLEEEK